MKARSGGNYTKAGFDADLYMESCRDLWAVMERLQTRIGVAEESGPMEDAFAQLEDIEAALACALVDHEDAHGVEASRTWQERQVGVTRSTEPLFEKINEVAE